MQDAISHDPYEDQLSAARFKAERDVARQELDRMRPAFEWVEEHGGLEKIKQQRIDSYPRDAYERKRGKLLKHIAECEKALGKRKKRVEDLEAEAKGLRERIETMLPRLMPEGYMWPEFENGDPVRIGDEFVDGGGNTRRCTSIEILHGEEGVFDALIHWSVFDPFAYLLVNMWLGGRVKRPAPKVLDADGVEIREGDTLWHVETGEQCKVVGVDSRSVSVDFRVDGDGTKHTGSILSSNLTHRAPILASDGRPLEAGQTVYAKNYGYVKCTVLAIEWVVDGYLVEVENEGGHKFRQTPDEFTHQRPVLDADGVEIREGDTVYEVKTGDKFVVETIYPVMTEPDFPEHTVRCHKPGDITAHMFAPDMLTHRAPVLAADGKPLRVGETVWDVKTGREYVVVEPSYGKTSVVRLAKYDDAEGEQHAPDQLTHERPETDSWQRLGEDVSAIVDAEGNGEGSFTAANAYCERNGLKDGTVWVLVAQDLVRRAKKLAERGE